MEYNARDSVQTIILTFKMSTSCESASLNRAITSTSPSLILPSDSGALDFMLVFEKKGDTLITNYNICN